MAHKIEALNEIIGKYEHNENLPFIEKVTKMAKAIVVTVDYLIEEGGNASFNKETQERLNDIQKMDEGTKSVLFNVINTYIQIIKTKKAFAK